jgi:hypothetical protein
MLAQASWLPMPERTIEDVLSESAVEIKAADAADALAAVFEEEAAE